MSSILETGATQPPIDPATPTSAWSPDSLVSKDRWGPLFWDLSHLVSFAYPENPTPKEREDTARFYESLASVLPCEECKRDYGGLLQRYPVRDYLDSRESLSRWCYDLHNMVNAKLGKPITVTYEQARRRFVPCERETLQCKRDLEQCAAASSHQRTTNRFLVAFALVALAVGGLLWWSKLKQSASVPTQK